MSSPIKAEMYNHMSQQFSPMSNHSNHCSPNNQHMSSHSGCEVAGSMGEMPPIHHPANSHVSMIRADNMTVEQTGEWVRTLGRYNLWEEADEYAKNFVDNNIGGVSSPKVDE